MSFEESKEGILGTDSASSATSTEKTLIFFLVKCLPGLYQKKITDFFSEPMVSTDFRKSKERFFQVFSDPKERFFQVFSGFSEAIYCHIFSSNSNILYVQVDRRSKINSLHLLNNNSRTVDTQIYRSSNTLISFLQDI